MAIGGFFAIATLLMVAFRGPRILEGYHTSVLGLVGFDLIGGAVTGAIVGVLLPFAQRSAVSASVTGFVAMLPASVVGMLMVTPNEEWHEVVPIGSIVGAALLGGLVGPLLRSSYLGETTPNWRFLTVFVAVSAVLALLMYLAGWW